MAKKGRQNVSRKQPNPRKIQRNEATQQENRDNPKAEPASVSDNLLKANTAKAPADENLGHVLGLQNLGHTCFFNAAVQVLSLLVIICLCMPMNPMQLNKMFLGHDRVQGVQYAPLWSTIQASSSRQMIQVLSLEARLICRCYWALSW